MWVYCSPKQAEHAAKDTRGANARLTIAALSFVKLKHLESESVAFIESLQGRRTLGGCAKTCTTMTWPPTQFGSDAGADARKILVVRRHLDPWLSAFEYSLLYVCTGSRELPG